MAKKGVGIDPLPETNQVLENIFNDIICRKSYLWADYESKPGLHDKISFDSFLVDDYKLNQLYWKADQLVKKLILIHV